MANLLSAMLSRLKQPRQRIKILFHRAFSKSPLHVHPNARQSHPESTSATTELTVRVSEDADAWSGNTTTLLNTHDVYVNTVSTQLTVFDDTSTIAPPSPVYYTKAAYTLFPKTSLTVTTSGVSSQTSLAYMNRSMRSVKPQGKMAFGTINTSHAVASRTLLVNAQCKSVPAISSQTTLRFGVEKAVRGTTSQDLVVNSEGGSCDLPLGTQSSSLGLSMTNVSGSTERSSVFDSRVLDITSPEETSLSNITTPTPTTTTTTTTTTTAATTTTIYKRKHTNYSTPLQTPLSSPLVHEVITLIGKYFPHIPHAICGSSALTYHGNTLHAPKLITMLVSLPSVDILKCWAVAQGLPLSPYNTEDICIRTSDGHLRCVRIIPIPEEELVKRGVEQSHTSQGAKVLSLPYLADDLARTFMVNVEKGSRFGQAICLRDLGWVLGRIRDGGGLGLAEGERLEGLWDGEFVRCCLGRWPGLRGLLAAAGVEGMDEVGGDGVGKGGSLRRKLTELVGG